MYSDATLPVIYYPPEGPWSYVDVIVAVEEDFVEIKRTYSDDLPGISYFFPLGLIQISLKH